jgi:acyl-CoA hydrolase
MSTLKGGKSKGSDAKAPAESSIESRELILPNDTNTHGNVLGGKVLHVMDLACAMSAMRHCRRPVVTVAMDHVEFLSPIPEGHFMTVLCQVNTTGRTSMEIGVKVCGEHPLTGEVTHTSSAYLTFVALDGKGCPMAVPGIEPTTDAERRRYEEGQARLQQRRDRRRKG